MGVRVRVFVAGPEKRLNDLLLAWKKIITI
jgi:hypothetical protein